jgi:hypothetical protein
MATSHPEMFQKSTVDESEILKLIENHFLPDRKLLRWHPAKGEDIPTPNINKIVVLSSFSNVDSAYPLVNSTVAFFTIIKSN